MFGSQWFDVLLSVTVKATGVLVVGIVVRLLLARGSAAIRHLVWTGALAGVASLPLASLLVPAWQVPIPTVPVPASVQDAIALPVDTYGSGRATHSQPGIPWQTWALAVWGVGCVSVVGRLLVALMRLRQVAASAQDFQWPGARNIVEEMGCIRSVRLLASERCAIPLTFGAFRPVILLPANARDWPVDRLRMVLAHELMHVRRLDWAIQMIVEVAKAIYWFHPLVWMAAREFRKERERACDDGVLELGARASDYAGHLLEIARAGQRVWTGAAAMAQNSDLEGRLIAMLNSNVSRRKPGRVVVAFVFVVTAVTVAAFGAFHASAQTGVGRLLGTIHDPSGARIAKAIVTATSVERKDSYAATTTEGGEFSFPTLPDGDYTIEVRKPGFAQYSRRVRAPRLEPLEIRLELGRVSDTIEVIAGGRRPTTPSAGPPRRIRIGGAVQATKLIHMQRPVYPARAKEAGIEGIVMLLAVISKEGTLLNITPMNSNVDPDLLNAATEAVKQWQYQPTLLNGEPVEVITTITVNFRFE
jgi:TonB family protein